MPNLPRPRPLVVVALALAGLGWTPDAAAAVLSCGALVTTNTTLTADVVCSAANSTGLRIGANGVTVDFNGYKIVIPGSGTGVLVSGRSNVVLTAPKVQSTTAGTGTGISILNATNLRIRAGVLDGLRVAVTSTGANPGLEISGTSVRNATSQGMSLSGLTADAVIDANVFDGDANGLLVQSATSGPIVVGSLNRFTGVSPSAAGVVVSLKNLPYGARVEALDLSTAGIGTGIRLENVVDATIVDSDLSGLSTGIQALGTTLNRRLTIRNVAVDDAVNYGMNLDNVDETLILEGCSFDGTLKYGLRLQDLQGPWALDPTNTFTFSGAGSSAGRAVWLKDTTDVTLAGLDLSATQGTAVYLEGSVRTVIDGNGMAGRRTGVATSTALNAGLVITGNDLSGTVSTALSLAGVDRGLVVTGNDFTGAAGALSVSGLVGPWTLGVGNVFTNVAPATAAITLTGGSDLTLSGLDLSGTGSGTGVSASGVTGLTLEALDVSSRATGVSVSSGCQDVLVDRVDASGASSFGLSFTGVNGLDVRSCDVSLSRNGLYLKDLTGTPLLDLSGTAFDDLAVGAGYAVRAVNVGATELQGVTTSMPDAGIAVSVESSTGAVVSDLLSCRAGTGVRLQSATGALVTDSVVGAAPAGVTSGVVASGGGGHVVRDSAFGGLDRLVSESGTSPATATSGLATLDDTDGDLVPDLCDVCPLDPLDQAPCAVTGCAGGDHVTDVDGDGWCAGTGVGSDCDDGDAGVYPTAAEVCDAVDQDCDGKIDEGAPFADVDGDTCGDCAAGPADPTNDGLDTDGDGACDAGDPDDDDDTVVDASDADPLDAYACQDLDADGCDDCSVQGLPTPGGDGTDTDADGFCNVEDFTAQAGVLVSRPSWNAYASGGAGAPTVVWDTTPATDAYVMVYETQTGAAGSAGCPQGTWTLGLATSTDGLTWTDAGAPLVTLGGYYSCVAAHPTMVRNGTAIVLFFKAEDPSGFTGLGRMALTWNGAGYSVTPPDPTPALASTDIIGYPKAIYDADAGRYRVAYTVRANGMYLTQGSGSALGALDAGTLSTVVPGSATWAPDEVLNPALVCEADGSVRAYVGGRDLGPGATTLDLAVGRMASTDFATWTELGDPTVSLSGGDPELRHWDVLRTGTSGHVMYFSEKPVGSPPRIRLMYTGDSRPAPSTTQDKVCD